MLGALFLMSGTMMQYGLEAGPFQKTQILSTVICPNKGGGNASYQLKDLLNTNIFRTSNQTYILWEIESPAYLLGFQPSQYRGFFNWTMTYRQDSTVSIPYGKLRKIKEHPQEDEQLEKLIGNFGEKNSHLARKGNSSVKVAWMVSNCLSKSNREGYVEALKKFIDVDVFGSCYKDSKICEKNGSDNCWNYISEHYKFYLSFERFESFLSLLCANEVNV